MRQKQHSGRSQRIIQRKKKNEKNLEIKMKSKNFGFRLAISTHTHTESAKEIATAANTFEISLLRSHSDNHMYRHTRAKHEMNTFHDSENVAVCQTDLPNNVNEANIVKAFKATEQKYQNERAADRFIFCLSLSLIRQSSIQKRQARASNIRLIETLLPHISI